MIVLFWAHRAVTQLAYLPLSTLPEELYFEKIVASSVA